MLHLQGTDDPGHTIGSTIMKTETGMCDIRELTVDELDIVTGGKVTKTYHTQNCNKGEVNVWTDWAYNYFGICIA
jgi:hypothetical protein